MGTRAPIAVLVLSLTLSIACGDGPTQPGSTNQAFSRPRYEITGVVAEEGLQDFPIVGAQVRLVTSGLTATTINDGTFAIVTPPSTADTEMDVSKAGFATARVAVPGVNGPAVKVQLHRTVPPPDYSGTYTLTFGDGNSCTTLPASLRQRIYTATLTQSWPYFEIRLSGAPFVLVPDGLGSTTGNRLRGYIIRDAEMRFFSLASESQFDGTSADIAEQLSDGTTLVISGNMSNAVATLPSGTITGEFTLYSNLAAETVLARCTIPQPYSLRR